jgi:hypothetical protein
MLKNSKLAIIALVTAIGIASPALAHSARYALQIHSRVVNSDSPALTGGGSQGSNELAHYNTQ